MIIKLAKMSTFRRQVSQLTVSEIYLFSVKKKVAKISIAVGTFNETKFPSLSSHGKTDSEFLVIAFCNIKDRIKIRQHNKYFLETFQLMSKQ